MSLLKKITTPEQLLAVGNLQDSIFFKKCEQLYGPLNESTFWKYRENLRSTFIYKGTDCLMGKPYHFVHVNQEDPTVIAYTPDEDKGKRDVKTYIKPGKYLARYTDMDNEEIKKIITEYKHRFVPPELKIAETPKDVVWVYENGPSSCMCRKGWATKRHPVLAYANSPDVYIAYILNAKKGEGERRVSARAVVRRDKEPHQYIRIYGDVELMKKALESKGIKESPNGLLGCKLSVNWVKPGKNKFCMPYLDGNATYVSFKGGMDIHGKFLKSKYVKVTKTKVADALAALSTSGFLQIKDSKKCCDCGEHFHRSLLHDIGYIADTSYICTSCFMKRLMDDEIVECAFQADGSPIEYKAVLKKIVDKQPYLFVPYEGIYYNLNALTTIGKGIDGITGKIESIENKCKDHFTNKYYPKEKMVIYNDSTYLFIDETVAEKMVGLRWQVGTNRVYSELRKVPKAKTVYIEDAVSEMFNSNKKNKTYKTVDDLCNSIEIEPKTSSLYNAFRYILLDLNEGKGDF